MKSKIILTSIFVSICFAIFGCKNKQTISGPIESSPFASTKPGLQILPEDTIIVMANVTRRGIPNDSLRVYFARSISGITPDYRWSKRTHWGQAQIKIDHRSGYYIAQAKNEDTGEIVAQWSSIPLNYGETAVLYLPIEDKALKITGFAKELLIAPTLAIFGDQRFVIDDIELGVNAEPIIGPLPPSYLKLGGSIYLRSTDQQEIRPNLEIVKVYVIDRNNIWEAVPVNTSHHNSNSIKVEVRDGPKWDSWTRIEVVLEVSDGNGPSKLVKASPQIVRFIKFFVHLYS